jgi:hypothetical protein
VVWRKILQDNDSDSTPLSAFRGLPDLSSYPSIVHPPRLQHEILKTTLVLFPR